MHMNQLNSSFFFCFFTLILGDNFFSFSMLAKRDCDESCTGKLATNSPKGPKFVEQTDLCVHTCRWRIWNIQNSAKILILLWTGRGVTERASLKRGDYCHFESNLSSY